MKVINGDFRGADYMPSTAMKPQDVIRALFANIYDRKNRFKFTHRAIHEIFYALKNKPEYGFLFDEFLFRKNNIYPICDLLDEILSEMQLTGTLSKMNPSLKVKSINFKENTTLEKLLDTLDDEEKERFEQMTGDFVTEINARKL